MNYLVQQHCINDAVFLAELLHAEGKCMTTKHKIIYSLIVGAADSAYLLATCYYQLKRVQEARYLLQSHTTNPQCALLYARCCLDLRELVFYLTLYISHILDLGFRLAWLSYRDYYVWV